MVVKLPVTINKQTFLEHNCSRAMDNLEARNNFVFWRKPSNPKTLVASAMNMLNIYRKWDSQISSSDIDYMELLGAWCLPEGNASKINMGGSYLQDFSTGAITCVV